MGLDRLIIADRCLRLSKIADDICIQLRVAKVGLKEKFFLHLLVRQKVLLRDIHILLGANTEASINSASILFRCLLDDFITVLYIFSGITEHDLRAKVRRTQLDEFEIPIVFDEEKIIEHTAKGFEEKFKMIASSRKQNEEFFGGNHESLATKSYEEEEWKIFLAEQSNHIFFRDIKERKWKKFPSVKDIVDLFPLNSISTANAHAFIVWKWLSNYVHYSQIVSLFTPESRAIEIDQLGEVMSYCYKTVYVASNALIRYGFSNVINDPTNLRNEIFAGFEKK